MRWTITKALGDRLIQTIKSLESQEEHKDRELFETVINKAIQVNELHGGVECVPKVFQWLKHNAEKEDYDRWIFFYAISVEWKIRQARMYLKTIRKANRIQSERTSWEHE